MVEAYPLYWPANFPRTAKRSSGTFKTSLAAALKNVQNSLKLFSKDSGKKLDDLVISSNVTLGAQNPKESGVAVWFTWDGLQVCIPVDRYEKVESNLQAIHHIIEARRTELRHGGLAIVKATFAGFKALPSSAKTRSWWQVLGISQTGSSQEIEKAYKQKAIELHPDKPGGSTEAFQEITEAYSESKKGN